MRSCASRIGRIAELVDVKRARDFLGQARGHILVIFRMPARDIGARHPHFRAERAHVRDFFLRHLVGNDEDDAITFGRGDERETEAGVAGGGFDDGAAGLEVPVALGRFDHGEGDAVLDRAGRVLVLQLHEELAGADIHARDLDQRCVADEREDGGGITARGFGGENFGGIKRFGGHSNLKRSFG